MFLSTHTKRLYLGALAGVAFALPHQAQALPVPGGTLDPTTIPKYGTPLVIPPVMNNDGAANSYDIAVRQFQQQILPGGHWNAVSPACQADPALCTLPATTVWSYGPKDAPLPDSSGIPGGAVGLAPAPNSQFNYPAYTVENTVNVTTSVAWINDLKDAAGNYLPHLLPIDQTLHWANPGTDCIAGVPRTDCRGSSQAPYTGPVPIVTHVHGAHVGPESDGYPEAWWLPDPTGSNFNCVNDPALADGLTTFVCQGTLANGYGADNTNVTPGQADFGYPNDQPSTTLWYHDHTLGMTRNNVYAGPAGFWLIREAGGGETGLLSGNLPGPAPVAGQGVLDLNVPSNPVRGSIREIPIAIQDRSFNADGSLFYPDNRAFFEGINPKDLKIPFIGDKQFPSDISPIWNPEAFFNTMVVNGVTWPSLEVAQAKYRLRLLNGCNSRFLNLSMEVVACPAEPGSCVVGTEIPFYQIGAEQSLLPAVVRVERGFKNGTPTSDPQEALLMGLAERADTIVDFAGLPDGTRVRMINTGPDAPFGGFPDVPADPDTSGQVMEFVVTAAYNGLSKTDPGVQDGEAEVSPGVGSDDASDPMALLLSVPEEDSDAYKGISSVTRDLALLEEESIDVCVRIKPNGDIKALGSVRNGPQFLTECAAAGGVPMAPKAAVLGVDGSAGGTVQLWSDPIAQNPELGATETWELWNWSADAHPIHLHLVKFKVQDRQAIGGAVRAPEPTEAGWKDTVIAYPGEVTRVSATFDLAGLYVWHCHIVEHEDNEMMVPYCVGDAANAPGCAGL
jgi:FtsP/CotA-like multicopper oxidase with cupredoxin domain